MAKSKVVEKDKKNELDNQSADIELKGQSKNEESKGGKKKVIIVESPAKAKTIERILGNDYQVISSKGHIRDLPQKQFGVDLNSLKLDFEIIPGKESVVEQIKKMTSGKEVLLPSDQDREGEAIAWHLSTILGVKGKNIITFTEITERAIKEAVKNPREIDMNKVNAQLARRVLDRIVGYMISPLLWRIIKDARSAGRVQSAALKIICERERERYRFVPQKYFKVWIDIAGLKAYLTKVDGKKIKPTDITEEISKDVLQKVKSVRLVDIDVKEVRKNPPAPFITSTLQQDAASKLGFPVSKTMKIAQELYEGVDTKEGHTAFITYMRTDSTRVSDVAKEAAEKFILKNFGREYLNESSEVASKKGSKTKGKVQDAHECIRPVDVNITPEKAKELLDKDHHKLYELIWKRFIASQMSSAIYKQYSYDFESGKYVFEASIRERIFDGFEKVYTIDNEPSEKHKELKVDQEYLVEPKSAEAQTTPPDRYTEASLVKTLEMEGIGRPSTYATIIQTLLDRGYVVKKRKTLIPTILGFVVNHYLEQRFPDIVDKGFTAEMEKELDEVENGKKDWKEVVKSFLKEFNKDLERAKNEFFAIDFDTDITCEDCSGNYKLKVGKYGLYLHCPNCKTNKALKSDVFGVIDGNKLYVLEEQESQEENGEKNSVQSEESSANSGNRKFYRKRRTSGSKKSSTKSASSKAKKK
uniref:DNA topoisomerase 1 n=1 Tax=Fervidobacterium islandicum TaxID=2423 RepID=TOP1_FERIS|nr:RecName: Full=DNA topoisomerase 1; AltName: Full=DNA topoisomerase I; AltName: Full=Omega-protein; AltName: Full=Relaxing enzyme; AltName: Full=Swivelase; AltName: Full=Untwisting enzyme [Fervidobacterium islandicum]AAB68788.1 DNA topoisomerase I [Fervidobacterium islandicum]